VVASRPAASRLMKTKWRSMVLAAFTAEQHRRAGRIR
jgi:hypothetical protein